MADQQRESAVVVVAEDTTTMMDGGIVLRRRRATKATDPSSHCPSSSSSSPEGDDDCCAASETSSESLSSCSDDDGDRPCRVERDPSKPVTTTTTPTTPTTTLRMMEQKDDTRRGSSSLLPWTGLLVWPAMLAVPLILSSPFSVTSYANVFPREWYSYNTETDDARPKPLGLILGIVAVAVGQVFVLAYFYLHRCGALSGGNGRNNNSGDESSSKRAAKPTPIQTKGAPTYDFAEGVTTHLSQPEGFVLLVLYLSSTWLCNLMPPSYYSFDGTIDYGRVAACLVCQDGFQYVMHRLEHSLHPALYKASHKPHHKFTNPRLFDAFNGSMADTILMILIPLYATANVVRGCNVWTYMAFGSLYANWLTLIHSEYVLPWDGAFRALGLGTPGDHHVHHKFFKYNYGHLCLWYDWMCGTYRDPRGYAPKAFSVEA